MKKRDTRILDAIRHGFSRRRGHAIPEGLRKLALSGLHRGHTAGQIARAAGISRQSVVNWERQGEGMVAAPSPSPAPMELKVIESGPQDRIEREESEPVARIRLRSGAIVDLPARALDPRWLIALNGGVL